VREPPAAAIDGRAVRQVEGPDAAADAIARFEDDDRLARLRQSARGGEPGVAGADDTDVHIDSLHASMSGDAGCLSFRATTNNRPPTSVGHLSSRSTSTEREGSGGTLSASL